MIEDAGAFILYLPPYSPDFNPIEMMFNQYKMATCRYARNMYWADAHFLALECVSRTNARNYYRKCKVPGCSKADATKNANVLLAKFFLDTYQQRQLLAQLAVDGSI